MHWFDWLSIAIHHYRYLVCVVPARAQLLLVQLWYLPGYLLPRAWRHDYPYLFPPLFY